MKDIKLAVDIYCKETADDYTHCNKEIEDKIKEYIISKEYQEKLINLLLRLSFLGSDDE